MKPGIDFTGGTLIEYKYSDSSQENISKIRSIAENLKIEINSIQTAGKDSIVVKMKSIDKSLHEEFKNEITKINSDLKEIRYETVGPAIGSETSKKAASSVIIASVMIVLYIAWAFRKIPRPYSSFKFGICAVAALLHDVFLVIGIFSILGHFFHVEIDSLFITALLTIMGFSVHDSIVVFDRIRENLIKFPDKNFEYIVNESIVQTLARSLSTSLTVIFTLSAMLFFGGESIRNFIIALLIGIVSGTYSSIFNAAPLLVIWEGKK
jgi:preprotein translocase subunit SecF